jgi:hypothetical protein
MSFEQFEDFPIGDDDFFGGGKGGDFNPSTDLNFDESGGLSFDEDETPEVEADPIVLPGSDGPLSDYDFDVLGQSARKERGMNMLVPIVGTIVLLGLVSTGFFFLRNRRRAEAGDQQV